MGVLVRSSLEIVFCSLRERSNFSDRGVPARKKNVFSSSEVHYWPNRKGRGMRIKSAYFKKFYVHTMSSGIHQACQIDP